MASYVIDESAKSSVNSAGFLEENLTFNAVMNSKGLFAYNKGTLASFSSTVRTTSGNGSSRFEKSYVDVNNFDTNGLTSRAIERSKLSVNPSEISPGRYTVILEPSAAADMVSLCLNFMNARPADEGRSFFSKKGGGNKIGELLARENVNIYSDPSDTKAASLPFFRDGFPREKTLWFENGVLKNLHRTRFWAQKTNEKPIAYPSNVIMQGSDKTLEQLIAESENAVLVTRFWYIRTVDPATMLLTGLTRDGVFEIRDGKITRPVKNFRFNESPVNVLANLLDMGIGEKSMGSETGNMQIYVPPLKVANFNFSSLSDAI
jgi:predicted Zn-dependent protease